MWTECTPSRGTTGGAFRGDAQRPRAKLPGGSGQRLTHCRARRQARRPNLSPSPPGQLQRVVRRTEDSRLRCGECNHASCASGVPRSWCRCTARAPENARTEAIAVGTRRIHGPSPSREAPGVSRRKGKRKIGARNSNPTRNKKLVSSRFLAGATPQQRMIAASPTRTVVPPKSSKKSDTSE
jgi:hypothetical protein